MKNQNKQNGLYYIFSGIILFLLRYIPLHKHTGFIKGWTSLSEDYQVCQSILAGLAKYCSWVEPLVVIHILAVIGLAGYGIFLLYKAK